MDELDLAAYIQKHICRGGKGIFFSQDASADVCTSCGMAAPYCSYMQKIKQAAQTTPPASARRA